MNFDQLLASLTTRRASAQASFDALDTEARGILAAAARDGQRALNATENTRSLAIVSERAALRTQLADLDAQIATVTTERDADAQATRDAQGSRPGASEARAAGPARGDQWINADTGERAALRADESLAAHPMFERFNRRGDDAIIGQHGTLGQMIRSLTTTSGSAIVPTLWAADFIDRVRNKAAVIQAGASVIPMPAKTINIGRLTGDPTVAFRLEGGQIASADPTFDNVTLTAKSLDGFVKTTREWIQDADNGDELIENALADSLALKIDQVALYGGITAGAGTINLATPPNPRGVLATLNAVLAGNVLGGATNGTALTATAVWNEIIDTIFKVRDGNEEPNAAIWSTKLARQFAKAYDTTGQPIRMPQAVEELQRFVSNQIPSYTQGTMANIATDVFVGDWNKLLIGERLSLEIEVNTQLYAETGEIGIFIHWRGDIAPARPSAFAVYRALGGAA